MKKTLLSFFAIAMLLLVCPLGSWALPSEPDAGETPAHAELSVGEIRAAALDSLKELGAAYSEKRRGAFMRLVSDDFQGDLPAFEDAVIKDFRQYRDVNLNFIPDFVTVQGAEAEVSFRYDMSVIDNTGTQTLYRGQSAYAFKREDGKMKLVRMAQPIIFGNSLPESDNPIAVPQGPAIGSQGSAPGAVGGTTLTGSAQIVMGVSGFRFSTESNVSEGSADILVQGSGQGVDVNAGGGLEALESGSLSSITSVPSNPSQTWIAPVTAGDIIAVKTPDGKYAAIRITSVVPGTITFEYKYQPNGSTSF